MKMFVVTFSISIHENMHWMFLCFKRSLNLSPFPPSPRWPQIPSRPKTPPPHKYPNSVLRKLRMVSSAKQETDWKGLWTLKQRSHVCRPPLIKTEESLFCCSMLFWSKQTTTTNAKDTCSSIVSISGICYTAIISTTYVPWPLNVITCKISHVTYTSSLSYTCSRPLIHMRFFQPNDDSLSSISNPPCRFTTIDVTFTQITSAPLMVIHHQLKVERRKKNTYIGITKYN